MFQETEELGNAPHCESRSCRGASCINSVHVHRWCGCPLAGGSEKGAISTQMCLIASTLSWSACGSLKWPNAGPGALAGARGQVDAASGSRKCRGRLGVCSCAGFFFFPSLIWLIGFGASSLLLVRFSSCLIQSASLLHD